MTIQSSSPRTIAERRFGAVCRLAAVAAAVSAECPIRVEGFGGSTSRMIRRISASPADFSSRVVKGVDPVRSS
ncbi:MAG: hypothetical protein RBU36_19720 [Thermoanaerobaculia bacterium]|jgi:hypothetical protein|nr:hypothetical protein [Thermoanaerobaculia bacterium]